MTRPAGARPACIPTSRDSPGRSGFVLPQTGIFAQGTAAHHFLELDLHAGVKPIDAIASFRRLRAPEVSSGGVNVVLAFSASAWGAVAPPEPVPSGLAPFRTMAGAPGEGGSHVLAMRWVDTLDAFERLPVADQEAVIGRTKQESIELSDTVKPATAHIARVEIHDAGGSELPIYCRSVPYGSVSEHGLYFVAFSGERPRFGAMLERMFGRAGDGLRDRLTDFSRTVSGGDYFAPSLNALAEVGGPEWAE